MAALHPYSKTPHDGNRLNTICVISLTHFQHFLLLDFQIYHLFTAFSLFPALSLSLSGDPEPLSSWQVTKMSPLTRCTLASIYITTPGKRLEITTCHSFPRDLDKNQHSAAVFCAPRWRR